MIQIAGILDFESDTKSIENKTFQLKKCFVELYDNDIITYSIDDQFRIICSSRNKLDNENYLFDSKDIFCCINGDLFIDRHEIQKSLKSDNLPIGTTTIKYIPLLFNKYKEKITDKLTGWFNLIIYLKNEKILYIFNDQLGFRKLYYNTNKDVFVFSTSLSALVKTGIVNNQLDESVILQKLIFNYPITNHSFIKNVNLLDAASVVKIKNGHFDLLKYWNATKLMVEPQYNYDDGIELIDEAFNNTIDLLIEHKKYFGLSLTGGWDGRLILSYLVKKGLKNFFLYSFGTQTSSDVIIPQNLSAETGYEYFPIYLDNMYIKENMVKMGLETVINSDALRSTDIGHYLYAMKKIGEKTNMVLSGNCGSNLLKPLNSTGHVYNEYIKALFNGSNILTQLNKIREEFYRQNKIFEIKNEIWDDLFNDVSQLPHLHYKGLLKNQVFYSFLIDTIERMYFGAETTSYVTHLDNRSPFIEFNFVKKMAQTPYFGAHHGFFAKKDFLGRYRLSKLYAILISKNSKKLGDLLTDRNYKLNDLLTITGNIKVIGKSIQNKFLNVQRGHGLKINSNVFLEQIFNKINVQKLPNINYPIKHDSNTIVDKKVIHNYYSVLIWYNSLNNL